MKSVETSHSTVNLWNFGQTIFKQFPVQITMVLISLFLAAILEIIGLAAVLPVITELLSPGAEQNQLTAHFINFIPFKVETLGQGLLLIVTFMTLRGTMIFFSQYLIGYVSSHLEQSMRQDIMSSLLKAKWSYHINHHGGNFTNAIMKQTEYCAQAALQFGQFLIGIIMACFLLTASILVSWQAFIVFILSAIPYILLSQTLNKKMLTASRRWVVSSGNCSGILIDILSLAKFLKASALENEAYKRFKKASDEMTENNLLRVLFKAIIVSYPEIFGILTIAILVFTMYQLQLVSPQNLIFFLLLMYRAYSQIARVQSSLSALSSYIPSYEAINKLNTDAAMAAEETDGKDYDRKNFSDIILKDLEAGYNDGENIIQNIDLIIPKNKITAFVGRSGSGKTTLVDTVIGLLKPTSGQLEFDESQSLTAFNNQQFRENIGYVPQDAYLMRGTIRENILIGATDKSEENMKRATALAHIDGFIDELPEGYDTIVGDRGSSLSGGQKQRVALARALARNPDILILDEATSALDNETEKLVHDAITSLRENLTIILIAHRLSTVKEADIIYMLEQGHVVDKGTFKELMKNKGDFAKLYHQ